MTTKQERLAQAACNGFYRETGSQGNHMHPGWQRCAEAVLAEAEKPDYPPREVTYEFEEGMFLRLMEAFTERASVDVSEDYLRQELVALTRNAVEDYVRRNYPKGG